MRIGCANVCTCVCMSAYVKETDDPESAPLAYRLSLPCGLCCHTNVFISLGLLQYQNYFSLLIFWNCYVKEEKK